MSSTLNRCYYDKLFINRQATTAVSKDNTAPKTNKPIRVSGEIKKAAFAGRIIQTSDASDNEERHSLRPPIPHSSLRSSTNSALDRCYYDKLFINRQAATAVSKDKTAPKTNKPIRVSGEIKKALFERD